VPVRGERVVEGIVAKEAVHWCNVEAGDKEGTKGVRQVRDTKRVLVKEEFSFP
jgi:hypothetical protein